MDTLSNDLHTAVSSLGHMGSRNLKKNIFLQAFFLRVSLPRDFSYLLLSFPLYLLSYSNLV